jgi:hypothetical protein
MLLKLFVGLFHKHCLVCKQEAHEESGPRCTALVNGIVSRCMQTSPSENSTRPCEPCTVATSDVMVRMSHCQKRSV